jgi:hypothetical protein
MGGSHDYLEAGKRHADTVAYKDEDMLSSVGHKHPDHITNIRIWWSEFVVGMEVFYDGVSAGTRLGTHHRGDLVAQDFTLGQGEYITSVYGRAGDLIDNLNFVTNSGRVQSFGASTGGDPFNLAV